MNKTLLTVVLAIATIFTSCNKEDSELSNIQDPKTTFNITIDGLATRAIAPTRYIMEVYQVTNPNDAVSGTPLQRFEAVNGTFDVILKEGVNYACLFFADYGNKDESYNEYNAENLKEIKIIAQTGQMAYGGAVRFTYQNKDVNKPYLNVTLKHIVAQINFIQIEDFTSDNNKLVVLLPKTFALNLDGNIATEIAKTNTLTFTGIPKISGRTAIGMGYIIAAYSTQTVMDIKTTFNDEVVKTISNVPFQCNYRTNISGAYSNLYETTISVSCEEEWETPDNNITKNSK